MRNKIIILTLVELILAIFLISLVNAGDYVILTTKGFESSITNLTSLRSNYNVIVRYMDGNSKEAFKGVIRDYYNKGNLSYVLLIGDINTIENDGSDYYYSNIDDTGNLDIAVGRIPFDSSEKGLNGLRNYINKLIYYENNKLYEKNNALLIAGSEMPDAWNYGFQTATYFERNFIPIINNSYNITKSYFKCSYKECPVNNSDPSEYTYKTAMDNFNKNNIIFYQGHGGNQFMPYNYFPADYLNLTGNNYNIFIAPTCSGITYNFTCNNKNSCGGNKWAYFTDEVLISKEGGSVGVIASAVETSGGKVMMLNLAKNLKNNSIKTLGEAYLKSNPSDQAVILGDPALTINSNIINKINTTNITIQNITNQTNTGGDDYNEVNNSLNNITNNVNDYLKGFEDGKNYQKTQSKLNELTFWRKILDLLTERIKELD